MTDSRKANVIADDVVRDTYGFIISPQYVPTYREHAPLYTRDEAERSDSWEQFLFPHGRPSANGHWQPLSQEDLEAALAAAVDASACGGDPSRSPSHDPRRRQEQLHALVKRGLPMSLRGALWRAFLKTTQKEVAGHYQQLVQHQAAHGTHRAPAPGAKWQHRRARSETHFPPPSPSEDDAGAAREPLTPQLLKMFGQIDKDLPRTFPGHPAMDGGGQTAGREALWRVLSAYARHNPAVGYCQGMNFLAGMLLLFMSEEAAFWALSALVEDVLPGYFSQSMVAPQVDQLVLQDLVAVHLAPLYCKLEDLGVPIGCVGASWFLCLFVNSLPGESVLRVWDVLLFEGSPTVLFRVAVALLEMHSPALLQAADTGDLITEMQSLAPRTFDANHLLATACEGPLRHISISQVKHLQELHRPEVVLSIASSCRSPSSDADSPFDTATRALPSSPPPDSPAASPPAAGSSAPSTPCRPCDEGPLPPDAPPPPEASPSPPPPPATPPAHPPAPRPPLPPGAACATPAASGVPTPGDPPGDGEPGRGGGREGGSEEDPAAGVVAGGGEESLGKESIRVSEAENLVEGRRHLSDPLPLAPDDAGSGDEAQSGSGPGSGRSGGEAAGAAGADAGAEAGGGGPAGGEEEDAARQDARRSSQPARTSAAGPPPSPPGNVSAGAAPEGLAPAVNTAAGMGARETLAAGGEDSGGSALPSTSSDSAACSADELADGGEFPHRSRSSGGELSTGASCGSPVGAIAERSKSGDVEAGSSGGWKAKQVRKSLTFGGEGHAAAAADAGSAYVAELTRRERNVSDDLAAVLQQRAAISQLLTEKRDAAQQCDGHVEALKGQIEELEKKLQREEEVKRRAEARAAVQARRAGDLLAALAAAGEGPAGAAGLQPARSAPPELLARRTSPPEQP